MAWIHLSQNCQVVGLEGTTLTLGFANAGARDSFVSSGCPDIVRDAAVDVVGASWTIETIVDPSAQPPAQAEAPVVVRESTEPAGGRPSRRDAASPTPEPHPPGAGARERRGAQRRPRRDPGDSPGVPTPPARTRSPRRTPTPTLTT